MAGLQLLSSVVLPLPVAPTSSWNAPSSTVQSSGPMLAVDSGYRNAKPRASIAFTLAIADAPSR